MRKKIKLCTGEVDMFSNHAPGDATDVIVCEAICPHPVLYTRAVWVRWNAWMKRQAKVFVKEWALDNPYLLAALMGQERHLARYDLRRIRTPQPLKPWAFCQDKDARWTVSLDGARMICDRRMVDRLADALAEMGGPGHE